MKIKLKIKEDSSLLKFETQTYLKEVLLNIEDIDKDKESIALAFKNAESSGIIELTPRELKLILDAVEDKKHLFFPS